MPEELKPLIALLGGEQGHAAQILMWIATLRVALKPFQAWLSAGMNKAVAYVAGTSEKDDDALLLKLVGSKPYRILAFLLDFVASVKLPSTDKVKEQLKP